jgi:hypothetical protein
MILQTEREPMNFISLFRTTRVRKHIILSLAFTFFITCLSFALFHRGSEKTAIAQAPLKNFYAYPDKEEYEPNETVTVYIKEAAPNSPIYWTNVISDVEVRKDYQYGMTDGQGNFTRSEANFGRFGWGSWKFYVSIAGQTKIVEFQVGTVMGLSINDREVMSGDTVTFSITGAEPNKPIYWSSSRNYKLTDEKDAFYGDYTDKNGEWMGSPGPLEPGQWIKQAQVGNSYSTVEFALGVPYAETGSLRWYALKAKAEGETEVELSILACGPKDVSSITLCEALEEYSLVRGNVKEVQTQVHENGINTWVRIELLEVLRNHPYSDDTPPNPPSEILSHMEPKDILVVYSGGSTNIEGVKVTYAYQNSPSRNFAHEFAELAPGVKDQSNSLLFIDWDQTRRIGYLSLDDKSVIRLNTVNDRINVQLGGAPANGYPFTMTQLRKWLADNPGC